MASMLPQKKTLARPLYRENTRQRGMLSRTLREKKETQGTTRNETKWEPKTRATRGEVGPPHPPHTQPTPQGPAHALSLQGEKCAVGQIEWYVFHIRISRISATHLQDLSFCFSSAF